MRGMARRMTAAIVEQGPLLRVNPGEQVIIHWRECLYRVDRATVPDIGWRRSKIGGQRRRRREPFERLRNTIEEFVGHGAGLPGDGRGGKHMRLLSRG